MEKNIFLEVRELNDADLKLLLKELSKISREEAPALVTKSTLLKSLFKMCERSGRYWIDIYHEVSLAVEIEILNRIKNDLWKQ